MKKITLAIFALVTSISFGFGQTNSIYNAHSAKEAKATDGTVAHLNSSVKKKVQKHAIDENAVSNFRKTNNTNNQSAKTATIASYQDTLWYFYSKQKFKNTDGIDQSFYTIQSAVSTNTNGNPVEFGSSFLNNVSPIGASVTVSGAALLVSRQPNSNPAGIPIKVYLYNANAGGVPTTKVDSALATITNTNGVFTFVAFNTPKTVSGSFFISYRNMALTNTDTLLAWVTGAMTATSSAPASQKFGEGLSYTRYIDPTSDALYSNTNFYGAQPGTDFEAVVIPVVSFSINANYTLTTAPNATSTPGAYCATVPMTFSNTTDPASLMYNRQFNFNKFIPYWRPFSYTVTILNPADSITNWSFTSDPNLYTKNAVVSPTATSSNYTATLTMKYRPSPRGINQMPSISDVKTGSSYSIVTCSFTGINTISGFENFNAYPNPTVNSKINLTGLIGSNTIMVYNMLGQTVSVQTSDKEAVSVDLSGQPSGSYFVKITNSNNSTKTIKVIN